MKQNPMRRVQAPRVPEEVLEPADSASADVLPQGLYEQTMLSSMHPCLQVIKAIGGQNRHPLHRQHWTTVHAFIRHEVRHDAGMVNEALLKCLVGALNGRSAREGTW